MKRLSALLLGLALMPVEVAAQQGDTYVPPEGCTGVLTIQTRGCAVSNIYTCAADRPGESWRLQFEQGGPVFLSKIDAETQWLESYDMSPPQREVLQQPATDPASLTELLETGIDTYDFIQTSDQRVTRIVGYDRLTGEDVVIDGEPLLGTEFNVRYESSLGRDLEVAGREYVSVKHRRFISGVSVRTQGSQSEERDMTPVEFIYPGEPGFFAKTPLYDCAASLARFVPPMKGSDQ
jgi:hypothetical protein